MAEMLSHREGRAYIVTTEGGSLPIEPLWNEKYADGQAWMAEGEVRFYL